MKFKHLKPFLHTSGKIVRMKALVTIHGKQYVDCNETNKRYPLSDLRELTPEEYKALTDEQDNQLIGEDVL